MTAPEKRPVWTSTPDLRLLTEGGRELIRLLAVLLRNSTLHRPDNEVFREPGERLQATVAGLLGLESQLDLECVGQVLWVNRVRVRMELRALPVYRFVTSELARRGLGGLRFLEPLQSATVGGLVQVLARRGLAGEDPVRAFNSSLAAVGVGEVVALPPAREVVGRPLASRRGRALAAYRQALELVHEWSTRSEPEAALNLRRAKRVVQRLVDLTFEEGGGFSLAGLAAIKSHNEYTFNHVVNVCVLAVAFGQRLGLARHQLAQLGVCALYHDIGKIAIPLEILEKHGPLTEQEWAVMGNHTVFGARTLLPLLAHDPSAVRRILTSLQHHRGFLEGGYPELTVLRSQSLFVRIVAIVDAFDAMTTRRVYQETHLPDRALATLKSQAGTRYDPTLVTAFINSMGVFPVGSAVVLTSGELAVVCESSADDSHVDRPTVRVIADADWRLCPPELADLSRPGEERRIARTVDPEPLGIDLARYVV